MPAGGLVVEVLALLALGVDVLDELPNGISAVGSIAVLGFG